MALELDTGKANVENEDGEGITIEDLASFMKVSTKTVQRDIQRGKYEVLKQQAGKPTLLKPPEGYTREAVESARAVAEVQAQAVTHQALIVELARSLTDARKHNERLLDLVVGPITSLSKQLLEQQKQTFDENLALHDKLLGQHAVVERLLTEEHLRKLETVKAEESSRRMSEALSMAREALPTVLEAMSVKGVNLTLLRSAEKVLKAIPLDQLEIILAAKGEDAILPPEVQGDAAVVLAELKKEAAKSSPPASGVADPGAGGA